MQVKGSVVVVSGGGSGIGAQIAKDLAAEGAKLVIAGRRAEALDQVVSNIEAAGGKALAVPTDILKEEQVANLMDAAIDRFGSLDVVIANAGAIADGVMINASKKTGKVKRVMSLKQFKSVVELNLVGSFLTVREGARRMVEKGTNGVVVITSSINSTGQPGQLNYSSTKAALTLWPKILAAEFHMKKVGIRVVGIAPGYTATEILKQMNQAALDAILKDVHIGRLVEPSEISSTVKYIMENEGVDGTTIEVTGGVTYGPWARVK